MVRPLANCTSCFLVWEATHFTLLQIDWLEDDSKWTLSDIIPLLFFVNRRSKEPVAFVVAEHID